MFTQKKIIVVECNQCGKELFLPGGRFIAEHFLANWLHISRNSNSSSDPSNEWDFCSERCALAFLRYRVEDA